MEHHIAMMAWVQVKCNTYATCAVCVKAWPRRHELLMAVQISSIALLNSITTC